MPTALTFYQQRDTGWPAAHTGEQLDPKKEWEFGTGRTAKKPGDESVPDEYLIIGYHRPADGGFFRYAWPTTPEGKLAPLNRPPTMVEMKTFVDVCLNGLTKPC